MSQLALFDPDEALLAHDERGRIVYTPRFVDLATAATASLPQRSLERAS